MNRWLTHNLNERKVMLRETAKAEHLPSSMIRSRFPQGDADTEALIPTVLPTRTFYEKVFLLCEEFQKDNPRSHRMSRHLYDIERLAQSGYAEHALADRQLYRRIVEHRRKFYHLRYVDYDKHYPPHILFLPPSHCHKDWQADYAQLCESFVYGEKKSFEDILQTLQELQHRFRNLDVL